MYEIPKKVKSLVPYEPITGNYKVRLDANESFARLSAEELSDVVSGVRINRYPDLYAQDVLNAFGRLYGVNPDYVTAGNGSDELISIITACLLNKDDKILVFSPDFSMYSFYPHLYELNLIEMSKTKDLEIDIEEAIEKINSEDIKAVIFSNPCNPTSLGISAAKVKKLINSVNALVILDEAYMDFWNEKESLLQAAHEHQNLIVLKTCSKALALAGIRVGFAAANKDITNALRAAKSPYNVNSLSQAVAFHVLSNKAELNLMALNIKSMTKSLKKQIASLKIKEFAKIYDTVTNFVFIETPDENSSNVVFKFLLDKGTVIRRLGKYLRITCGNPSENEILIRQLKEYIKEKS